MQRVPRGNWQIETEWALFRTVIHEQEETMAHYTALLQEHEEKAQAGVEYYRRLTLETKSTYRRICIMQQQDLTPDKSAELEKLKRVLCLC